MSVRRNTILNSTALPRILIALILLATLFLCSLLAVVQVQSTIYDYQYYMQDELREIAQVVSASLRNAEGNTLEGVLDDLETFFSHHGMTTHTFSSDNARVRGAMHKDGVETLLFTYGLQEGFVRGDAAAFEASAGTLINAMNRGSYTTENEGFGPEDQLRARLAFEAGGTTYQIDVEIPAREALLRSLPTISVILLCVAVVVVLLFLLFRYNQSMIYRNSTRNAQRTQLVLDHLQSSVHVTRPETGEMLFANQSLRDQFGLGKELPHKKCWEILERDQRQRCEFCPLYTLMDQPDQPAVWELHDAATGRCYRNTDYLIEWDDGSTVMMEHSLDITEEIHSMQRMQRQVDQQKLLSQLSIEVATRGEEAGFYDRILGMVGRFIDVDRVWVMHRDGAEERRTMDYLYEWHQDQLAPMSHYVPKIELSLEEYRTQNAQYNTQVTVVQLPQHLPVSDTVPFERMRLYSNAYIVLRIGGEPWGMLCVSMQERSREWPEEDMELIRTFSGILSAAIQNDLIQSRLRSTQRTLRSILEHIPLGIYWKDASSRYVGCNQRFLQLAGLEGREITGKSDDELHLNTGVLKIDVDEIAIQQGGIYEDMILHLDRHLRRKKLAVWGEDGELAFVLGILEDITQQMQAEEKRDESLSMLRAAMENYPGVLWSMDAGHNVMVLGGQSLLGGVRADYDAAVGRPIEQLYAHIPELVERSLDTYEKGAQNFFIEYNQKTYNFFTSQMLDDHGAVRGVIVAGIDMTQEMQLRHELEEAIVVAEQASGAKSDFLSRMSHEIRTPMNVIIGMCRMALRAKDPAKAKHSLLQIDASAKHLLGLINDILDMSKIEANKLELHNEPFNIEKMLMDVCSAAQVRAGERGQTIQVLMARGMPHSVVGDELRLSQVVTNLFTNAIKFSPESGNIVLSMKPLSIENNIMTLETRVRDHGIGMTEEQMARLFVSFEQADGGIARKYGGTGLGLAICKSIVTMMDGDIWAESEYGKGSTFIFTVRIQVAEEQAPRETARDLRGENLRTLVVDSSAESCDYVADILEGFGIRCDKALTSEAALKMASEARDTGGPYDIVFVDFQMPETDGISIIEQLLLVGQPVPVLMIAGAELGRVEDDAKRLGIRTFVPKPLFPSDLFNAVQSILGHTPASQDAAMPRVETTPNLKGHTVLLAEDMEFNREVAIGILEETGCEIVEAINGQEALELFQKEPLRYGCILMDMQMPGMDGLDATRAIRAIRGLPWAQKIPIIAMTANVFQDDIQKCLDAGMDDHIGKPISDTVLYEKLAFYLHSDAQKQRAQAEEAGAAASASDSDWGVEDFLPYIDVESGLTRLRSNKKLYATLLRSFSKATTAKELLEQMQGGRIEEATRTAHALKGVAGNIELTALYQATIDIESVLRAGAAPSAAKIQAFAETQEKTLEKIPAVITYLNKGNEG